MAAWFDHDGPTLTGWGRDFERNVDAAFRSRHPYFAPALSDRAARAHEPKANRPPNVTSKLKAARAYLHWLNAQIVRGHSHHDTPGREAA